MRGEKKEERERNTIQKERVESSAGRARTKRRNREKGIKRGREEHINRKKKRTRNTETDI